MIRINPTILILTGAVILDLVIGDPWQKYHPIMLIGSLIKKVEGFVYPETKNTGIQKLTGAILVIIVVSVSYFSSYYLIRVGGLIDQWLGYLISLIIFTHCLAIKSLIKAGEEVAKNLAESDLTAARNSVNKIVARDCSQISKPEVIRATLESLAENTSDGILAPIFFFLIGGVPLAMAYKAVNTIDSMVGYTNPKYINFGWAGARFDDLWNFIPARLTALSFIFSSLILGLDYRSSFKMILRDASKHPSPNAGYPESAIAGALGVRFGGTNYYHGQKSFRAYLGDPVKEFETSDINKLKNMIYISLLIFIISATLINLI